MDDFEVRIEKIRDIYPHNNADRLEVATVLGWQVVVQKGLFKKDDLVIYIPIDSILPVDVENLIFPVDSKIRLEKSRIRTIKLRGEISQGLVIAPETLGINEYKLGDTVHEKLGITKFEPPEPAYGVHGKGGRQRRSDNPYFPQYVKIENAKNCPEYFEEGEDVVTTEKVHGTNLRAGWVPHVATNKLEKFITFFKRLFKVKQEWDFVWGSHRVQLHNKYLKRRHGYYSEDVYTKIVNQYKLREVIPHGKILYGEIYGDGIQKGYTYGCKKGEHKVIFFEVRNATKDDMEYLKPTDAYEFIQYLSMAYSHIEDYKFVPFIQSGPFNKNKTLTEYCKGASILCPEQKMKEGCVVRSTGDRHRILKFINDDYLLKSQTDFH